MKVREKALLFLLIIICLALVAFLAGITVYSSDDYWYSTFMDGGVARYFGMMKEHYLTCNGRNLVHFFAQLILHFGNWLFVIFAVGIFLLIPLSVDKIRSDCGLTSRHANRGIVSLAGAERDKMTSGWNRPEFFMLFFFFAAGILLLPLSVMVNGILWISGFCNYVLPAGMAAAEIMIMKRFAARPMRHFFMSDIAVWIFAFLCGATTEQGGSVSVLICFFFLVTCIAENRRRILSCMIAFFCGVLGLLTIFLSPATRSRAGAEAPGQSQGMLQHFVEQAGKQAAFFSEYTSVLVMTALFFACTAAFFLLRKKRGSGTAATVLFLISSAFLAGLRFFDGTVRTASYTGVMFCLLIAAIFYLFTEYREISLLLLNALASLAVMLMTSSAGHRIYLPFCLWLLAALSWILSSLSARWRPTARIIFALLCTAVICVQMWIQIPGYLQNYRVDQMNHESARQARNGKELLYCIDYDMDYTHVKAYSDPYFYQSYLKSEGLPADTRVYFYSRQLPSVWAGDKKTSFPTVQAKESEYGYLLPLRDIVELLGGTVEVQSGWRAPITVTLEDRVYQCVRDGQKFTVSGETDDGEPLEVEGEIASGYYCTCVSENIYTDAFGLEVKRSEDGMKIMLDFS